MPSDDRTQLALEALAEPRARFRTAVAVARDQMAAYLATHRAPAPGDVPSIAHELGRFASGRIDGSRFAGIFTAGAVLADEMTAQIEQCIAVLDTLLARGDALFVCDVPSGGDLRDAVGDTLAEAGRAFGAVLAFQAAKTKAFRAEHHGALMKRFPFGRWNRSERLLAPPLIVEVDGADLQADQLTAFLDGHAGFVLVVRGPAAPAPLARLVSPGWLVAQTVDMGDVQLLARSEGPAVIALVPDGAARFVHTPRTGAPLGERLRVSFLPADAHTHALGTRSAAQQREERALLAELARLAEREGAAEAEAAVSAVQQAAGATPNAASGGVTTVDALASWLLGAAGFTAAPASADGARS